MTPCRRCGTPAAESICERCHRAPSSRLVPDGGKREEETKWNPAVNEEWDSQAREEYLERQSRPTDQPPSSETADNQSGSAVGSDSGSAATSQSGSAATNHSGEPDSESPPDPDELPQSEHQPDDASGSELLSRRRLLLGGAGLAVIATGGRRLLSSGPDGAKGIAEEYVTAIADNDWETAEQLFHEESQIRQTIDQRGSVESYEDVLGERGSLQFLSDIDPEIEGIHEWKDVPDPDAERPDARFVPSGARDLDGWKQIIAIVRLDAATLYRARGRDESLEQLEGEKTNEVFRIGTVKELTEWSIWSVSYPV